MYTTFKNGDVNMEEATRAFTIVSESMKAYMSDPKLYEEGDDDLPSFNNYGLSFDAVEDDDDRYYRYQICWGGPQYEIRFRHNQIEFVYLDWLVGVGFDITNETWAQWLKDLFIDIGMMN